MLKITLVPSLAGEHEPLLGDSQVELLPPPDCEGPPKEGSSLWSRDTSPGERTAGPGSRLTDDDTRGVNLGEASLDSH